jgi:hypothetical protein
MILTPRAGFRYPIDPVPPTAVLVPWFRQAWFKQAWFRRTKTRVFPRGWCDKAAVFAPAAIAATLDQLTALAASQQPPIPTHALIVLARKGSPTLSAADRERLWRAFRVPIFEQVIGPRGELLAAECEAHDGLHIETPGETWAGCTIQTAPCACGRGTPRLTPVKEPVEPIERARSAAAYAR